MQTIIRYLLLTSFSYAINKSLKQYYRRVKVKIEMLRFTCITIHHGHGPPKSIILTQLCQQITIPYPHHPSSSSTVEIDGSASEFASELFESQNSNDRTFINYRNTSRLQLQMGYSHHLSQMRLIICSISNRDLSNGSIYGLLRHHRNIRNYKSMASKKVLHK